MWKLRICRKAGSGMGGSSVGGLSFSRSSYGVLTRDGVRSEKGYVTKVNGEDYGVNLNTGGITHIRSGMIAGMIDSDARSVNRDVAEAVKATARTIDQIKRDRPDYFRSVIERRRKITGSR